MKGVAEKLLFQISCNNDDLIVLNCLESMDTREKVFS